MPKKLPSPAKEPESPVKPAKASKQKEAATQITIPALEIKLLQVKLVGDSPLISHKWSEKAKAMMLAKHMKQPIPKREAKDPRQDYEDSMYKHPDGGYGFPATAFKAAMVNACRFVAGIPMTVARGAFHVQGELIKINGKPNMREDMVRLETGVADIRYRGEFKEWSCEVVVRYNSNILSPEQLVNLLNTAGFAVGIGEWRPSAPQSKSGSYGMFHVE